MNVDRRSFLVGGVSSIVSLGLVDSYSSDEGIKRIEDYIHRDYAKVEERSKRNNQYLIDNVRDRKDVRQLLFDQKFGRRWLRDKIDALKKTDYRARYPGMIYNGSLDVNLMNPRQLVRVHLILDALGRKEFREDIMGEIETDIEDPQVKDGYMASERCGLIHFIEGEVNVMNVPSVYATMKRKWVDKNGVKVTRLGNYNGTMKFPEGTLDKNKYLFDYHLHATKNEKDNGAGPSFGFGNFKYGYAKDIGVAYHEIMEQGESHSLVMTKLRGKNFNVGYYGGEKNKKGRPEIMIMNLGDWPGG